MYRALYRPQVHHSVQYIWIIFIDAHQPEYSTGIFLRYIIFRFMSFRAYIKHITKTQKFSSTFWSISSETVKIPSFFNKMQFDNTRNNKFIFKKNTHAMNTIYLQIIIWYCTYENKYDCPHKYNNITNGAVSCHVYHIIESCNPGILFEQIHKLRVNCPGSSFSLTLYSHARKLHWDRRPFKGL